MSLPAGFRTLSRDEMLQHARKEFGVDLSSQANKVSIIQKIMEMEEKTNSKSEVNPPPSPDTHVMIGLHEKGTMVDGTPKNMWGVPLAIFPESVKFGKNYEGIVFPINDTNRTHIDVLVPCDKDGNTI